MATIRKATRSARYLADVTGKPFSVMQLRVDSSFYSAYRADQAMTFDKETWTTVGTYRPTAGRQR